MGGLTELKKKKSRGRKITKDEIEKKKKNFGPVGHNEVYYPIGSLGSM